MSTTSPDPDAPGSGTNLPTDILFWATVSALFSTALSLWTVVLQLKNYRKVRLQRFVVRILVMVPIYSLSSLISLYSLDAAFFVDLIRDLYEAFVIYCFFSLLVEYLGGERSLIILLHGRTPVPHPWPINTCWHPMDVSDPYTFLGLKRGILQYVQIKPVLAAATVVLKALGTYKDGSLEKDAGYTYISVVYNLSVCLSLYCLAMFWVATHDDLLPFRPMPKFLCVKGIIFFSFWQGLGVSILVAAGAVTSDRFPTETLSLAIQDTLICFEMPLFALLHLYAFSHTDYIDSNHQYSGRLPFFYALRDAFGFKDVFSDSITTVKGTGFSYRTFEPAEGGLHQGLGRDRRVRAGLRYAEGGKVKYWLPMPGEESDAHGRTGREGVLARPLHTAKHYLEQRLDVREGYAPIVEEESHRVLHTDTGVQEGDAEYEAWLNGEGREYDGSDSGESLGFGDAEREDEQLYKDSRRLEFGDFNYPIVDASKEAARRRMREEEEGIVHGRPFKPKKGKRPAPRHHTSSYGRLADPNAPPDPPTHTDPSDPATSKDHPSPTGHRVIEGARDFLDRLKGEEEERRLEEKRRRGERPELPSDAVDLVVEDRDAEEEDMVRERRRGEPGGGKRRIFRQTYKSPEVSRSGTPTGKEVEGGVGGVKVEVKDKVKEGREEVVRVVAEEVEGEVARYVDPPTPFRSSTEEENENPWG